MLNKLLKRCMPWMDKGRWMQIMVTATDPTDPNTLSAVYNDREIANAYINVSGGYPTMSVQLKHVPHIIDCKYCPEDGLEFMILSTDLSLVYEDDYTFDVPVMGPGTYWFFMR